MNKSLYSLVVSGLIVSSVLLCDGKKIDLSGLAQSGLTEQQKLQLVSGLTAYKNIVEASKSAQESSAYKKSLKQLTASFDDLVQTYAREVAKGLSLEEKEILHSIFSDLKDTAVLLKIEGARLNDPSTDKETKEQLMVSLNARLSEQYDQLLQKMLPFGYVLQQEGSIKYEDAEKNYNEFFDKINSFLTIFTDSLKK